jgi:DNA adenine methylase
MIPHPIPYQGSKRSLAKHILPFLPNDVLTLIEPFAGSAAVTIAAAATGRASSFHLNDLNAPLMALWHKMLEHPGELARKYSDIWEKQLPEPKKYYNQIRAKFNQTKQPEYLLYLIARCVKASIRYNPKGEFNQSPDNRRLGREPKRMARDIFSVSNLLRNRTVLTSTDYKEILRAAHSNDVIYMDPPYQGVCSNGDPRYLSGIAFEQFIDELDSLNHRNISYILSYDGRTGSKSFGKELTPRLRLHKIEIDAGRSSQSTLLGRSDNTYESLYLSPALIERLGIPRGKLIKSFTNPKSIQLDLPITA